MPPVNIPLVFFPVIMKKIKTLYIYINICWAPKEVLKSEPDDVRFCDGPGMFISIKPQNRVLHVTARKHGLAPVKICP